MYWCKQCWLLRLEASRSKIQNLSASLPTIVADDKRLKQKKIETEKAASEAEKHSATVTERTDATKKKAKDEMDTATAPMRGDAEAKIRKAKDVAERNEHEVVQRAIKALEVKRK